MPAFPAPFGTLQLLTLGPHPIEPFLRGFKFFDPFSSPRPLEMHADITTPFLQVTTQYVRRILFPPKLHVLRGMHNECSHFFLIRGGVHKLRGVPEAFFFDCILPGLSFLKHRADRIFPPLGTTMGSPPRYACLFDSLFHCFLFSDYFSSAVYIRDVVVSSALPTTWVFFQLYESTHIPLVLQLVFFSVLLTVPAIGDVMKRVPPNFLTCL